MVASRDWDGAGGGGEGRGCERARGEVWKGARSEGGGRVLLLVRRSQSLGPRARAGEAHLSLDPGGGRGLRACCADIWGAAEKRSAFILPSSSSKRSLAADLMTVSA